LFSDRAPILLRHCRANIRRPSPALRRAAAATAAAAGATVSQPPAEHPQPHEARRSSGAGGGQEGLGEERQAGGAGRDQGAERGRPAEPAVVNRRALSPSWRTGRRGDDDGEDAAAAAAAAPSSGKEGQEGARTPRRRSTNGAGDGKAGDGAGGRGKGASGSGMEAEAGSTGGVDGDSDDVEVVDVVGASDTEVRVANTSGANTGELGAEDSWEHVEER
jgi:hypothetical protein